MKFNNAPCFCEMETPLCERAAEIEIFAICLEAGDRSAHRGKGELARFALSVSGRFLRINCPKPIFPAAKAANRTRENIGSFEKYQTLLSAPPPECRLVKCILYKLRAGADR
jgi:hypothetical protein